MTKNEETLLTQILGEPMSEPEALQMIMQNETAWEAFRQLSSEQKQPLLNFFMGKSSLLITYDKFFREIFSPELHPERLESFLTAIMGEEVKIKDTIEREGHSFTEDSSLVIMDLLVEIGGKRIVNIEMQKVGLYFPGERSEVYASDLIMRQYTRIKNEKGKKFKYSDMPQVYVIILMDKSAREFSAEKVCDHYIHKRQVNYDSGASLRSLQNITYITLDTFREKLQNEGIQSLQDAWLTFFSSVRVEDILKLIDMFPEFREYYRDIAKYRHKPEEVIHMYSEAIAFLDHNTEQYMIEDMANQISILKNEKQHLENECQDLESRNQNLKSKNQNLESKNQNLESRNQNLESRNQNLESKNQDLESQNKSLLEEVARLKKLYESNNAQQ